MAKIKSMGESTVREPLVRMLPHTTYEIVRLQYLILPTLMFAIFPVLANHAQLRGAIGSNHKSPLSRSLSSKVAAITAGQQCLF